MKSSLPSISVALCTYNGSAHLPTQWQSVLNQEVLPNEVIISDDKSTDGTQDLLDQLTANVPFRVHILKNKARLGYNKNFEQALAACTGDLIFICDQDDYWMPEKIRVMTQYMTEHPTAQLAFCNAWVTDENLKGRQKHVWDVVRFDEKTQVRWQSGEMLDILLDGNRVMGCATVVRRSFLSILLPIPERVPGYIYDGWLALVGATLNAVHFINESLQLYRTHVQQQIGVREQPVSDRIRLRDRFTRHRGRKLAPLRKVQRQLNTINQLLRKRVAPNSPGLPQLDRRLAHFTLRSYLPQNRLKRIRPVLLNLWQGNYRRYADSSANWYAPFLAVLGDILE